MRPSPSRPSVVRVLILTVAPGEAHVHRRYVAARTVGGAEAWAALLRALAVHKSLVPGKHEWVDSFPIVPPGTAIRVNEKPPHDSPLPPWEEADFDPEVHFTTMEESVLREAENARLRALAKKLGGGKHGGHQTIEHLIRRDGPECCWCGRVTDHTLPETHPLRATVEHVIPSSRGGDRSLRNFRVACRKCNTVRGNKEEHPLHALRPKPPTRYPDPPKIIRVFHLPTTEDWEPTVEGQVEVSVAVSGKQWKSCTVYVKGGRVQVVYRVPNTGKDAEEHVLALADSIPVPVTFEGLRSMGFKWVRHLEPRAVQVRRVPT